MPGGRRPLYRPAYCDAVAAFRTINAFGRHIGVSTRTLYRWTQTYPEFADATRAMTRRHLGLLYRDDYCEAVAGFFVCRHFHSDQDTFLPTPRDVRHSRSTLPLQILRTQATIMAL